MNFWIVVKLFIAIFFTLFGVGMLFGFTAMGNMLGAAIASFGLTYLLRVWLVTKGLD